MAYVADVQSPVLGWNFLRKHKLDLKWNKFGDMLLYDRKAQISQLLQFKSLPKDRSARHHKLAVLSNLDRNQEEFDLPFMVAAMEALDENQGVIHEEDINAMPDSCYKTLLLKFPDLLKQDFNSDTKADVIHRIKLKEGAKPFKSKTRRLLPGSPRAILAKKEWQNLVDLGIVERVDPSETNLYSSPLHFADKPSGGLRPVGILYSRLGTLAG